RLELLRTAINLYRAILLSCLPINPPPRAQFRSGRNESPRTRDCDEPDIQHAKQRQHSSKMGVGLSSEGIVERGSVDSGFPSYRHYILANEYLAKSLQYRLQFICRQCFSEADGNRFGIVPESFLQISFFL